MGTTDYEWLANMYLRFADAILPGRITGFYVVGSAALGEYRPGRSDVDFVALLSKRWSPAEVVRARLIHLLSGANSTIAAIARGYSPFTGTCNGVFVVAADVAKPIGDIVPVASHTGEQFDVGVGFDVNPVVWKTLAANGVCFRGPRVDDLSIQCDAEALRVWNLRNLDSYWRPWAEQVLSAPGIGLRLRPRWWTSWGVLGAPRLHHTINTGEVISKESAGEYALSEFGSQWHSIVEEGLAYRRGKSRAPSLGTPTQSLHRAAEFVLHVVESAHRAAGRADP
ncbi:MAG: DUF4111 domain-containing protein [bacterium]|nr:DUF4111 domain-containing protein [bacterium]